jgi:hypothetical protein
VGVALGEIFRFGDAPETIADCFNAELPDCTFSQFGQNFVCRVLQCKMLVCFVAIWSNFRPFSILYDQLVQFVMLYRKNPAALSLMLKVLFQFFRKQS